MAAGTNKQAALGEYYIHIRLFSQHAYTRRHTRKHAHTFKQNARGFQYKMYLLVFIQLNVAASSSFRQIVVFLDGGFGLNQWRG